MHHLFYFSRDEEKQLIKRLQDAITEESESDTYVYRIHRNVDWVRFLRGLLVEFGFCVDPPLSPFKTAKFGEKTLKTPSPKWTGQAWFGSQNSAEAQCKSLAMILKGEWAMMDKTATWDRIMEDIQPGTFVLLLDKTFRITLMLRRHNAKTPVLPFSYGINRPYLSETFWIFGKRGATGLVSADLKNKEDTKPKTSKTRKGISMNDLVAAMKKLSIYGKKEPE